MRRGYSRYIKPAFDVALSLFILILTSPIILFTTIILVIVNGNKPFFFQKRPGKNGEVFSIIKFKTMTDQRDEKGELLPDSDRLTWVGSLVRKLSIDELPQMINVLKGDMSLVGPRPLLIEYLPLYNEQQSRRHDVKPGITGWAQVNGRNTLDWKTKFEYDVWYVENLSFTLDLKILFLTVRKVFIREGISSNSSATMEKFTGN